MNKECCPKCYTEHPNFSSGCTQMKSFCPCHTDKGEKKHLKFCSFKSPDAPCSCPTQPENSWETRFRDQFGGPIKGWRDAITTFPEVTQFIRTEIEQTRGKAFMDGFDDGQMSGLVQGRRDAMEELEKRIPKEYDGWTNFGKQELTSFEKGCNAWRTAVLNIIKSIKGE